MRGVDLSSTNKKRYVTGRGIQTTGRRVGGGVGVGKGRWGGKRGVGQSRLQVIWSPRQSSKTIILGDSLHEIEIWS